MFSQLLHASKNVKKEIEHIVYNFFVESNDFNGIPLRSISEELDIDYKESIDIIKELVGEEIISIQSSTNPHIIGFQHYEKDIQYKILDDAKNITVEIKDFNGIKLAHENTEYPICIYPSTVLLKEKRDLANYGNKFFSKQLALAEPHLKAKYFDVEVLDRYYNDPRFDFQFQNYSGKITCKYDENDKPIVREEDNIFLKTFGLGQDENGDKVAVVYLRYLHGLTEDHQIYWKSKESKFDCKMVKPYYENTIKGNWSNSYSFFSAFIGEQRTLNELSNMIFGKKLFKKDFDSDNRPREFTYFFVPTSKNYHAFVLLLDKMVSENFNKKFFKGSIELVEIRELETGETEKINKGTIRLFEEWLLSHYNIKQQEYIKQIFDSFKQVRRERQSPAHRIQENTYDKKFNEKQIELMRKVYYSMRAFRQMFQQHPKASNFKSPKWIDEGEIFEI